MKNSRVLEKLTEPILYLLILLSVLLQIPLRAQQSINHPSIPSVRVTARAQKEKILLRWAVDQPGAWQIANRYGFTIERYTIMRDGKTLNKIKGQKLNHNPIKPKPLVEWEQIVQTNDPAAIIAQCLFGESMLESPTGIKQTSVERLMDQKKELEQRFTFALLSADQNFEAALYAGWAYIDKDVKPNERYFYRVYTNVPQSLMYIDSSRTLIGLEDYRELPQPMDIKAEFKDKQAIINWNNKYLRKEYPTYFVERSEDSIHFEKQTLPLMTLDNEGTESPERLYYVDTLLQNDKRYYYRVRGISVFGEISPPSDIVSGFGRVSMNLYPNINDYNILNDSTVEITWVFGEDSTTTILDHFELSRSNESEKGFEIVETKLSKDKRTTTFVGLKRSNYFTIAAVDKYGAKNVSFPQLIQPIDSTPPSVPIGLEGIVNDSGVVNIKWQANKEIDIYGYHVFRGNIAEEEFALLTATPIREAQFVDTVNIKMLNKKVYYRVAALDERYNQSAASKVLVLDKPDKIPPVVPQFTDYKLTEGKIKLNWGGTPSDDIASINLYRLDPTNVASGQWTLTTSIKDTAVTTYLDTLVKGGVTYSYTLVAIDKSNNESDPSQPISLTAPVDKRNKAAVKDLRALVDRKAEKILIDWTYNEPQVVEFQVYRAWGSEPISLWRVIEPSSKGIVDEKLAINNVYRYAVRALFADGSMSTWKEIKVNY